MSLLPQLLSGSFLSQAGREQILPMVGGERREFPLASLLPIAAPLPSAKVCATAEKPRWADMPTRTGFAVPDRSQVPHKCL